jgi:hypothetical protein
LLCGCTELTRDCSVEHNDAYAGTDVTPAQCESDKRGAWILVIVIGSAAIVALYVQRTRKRG